MSDSLYELITEHNTLVNKIWHTFCKILPPEKELSGLNFVTIGQNISNHDYSKLDICEREGYESYYFSDKIDRALYNEARCHHCNKNQHHWEYWVTWSFGYPLPIAMPFICVIEMLCDWTADVVSIGFYDSLKTWYYEQKDEMVLSTRTKELIVEYLPYFDKVLEEISIK